MTQKRVTALQPIRGRCNQSDSFPREASLVDLLVRADQYYKLVQGDVRKGRPGTTIATKSRLGWLLSGPVSGSNKREEVTAMLTVTKIDSLDGQLRRFWEQDAVGIANHQEHQRTVEGEDAVNQFNSSCRFDGERYEVGLPWKKDHPRLVDNYRCMSKRTKDLFPLKVVWRRVQRRRECIVKQ